MSKYGICAGFWFDRRGHKAKRSDARFIYIYIYIANDESPSQHVTVGLAEARPNQKLIRVLTSSIPKKSKIHRGKAAFRGEIQVPLATPVEE